MNITITELTEKSTVESEQTQISSRRQRFEYSTIIKQKELAGEGIQL